MRAVGVREFGGPEALEVLELPEPHAGPGQVRLHVAAATVNPSDVATRAGLRPGVDAAPVIPGWDAAGVLDEVAADVTRGVADLTVGDAVIAVVPPFRPEGGAYVEKLVVDADQVAPAPAGTDLVHAATVPMNGLTALRALDLLDLPDGGVLAVSGAAGALGGYLLQLAALRGLRTIAIAREHDRELLSSLAPHDFVPAGPDVAARVRAVVPEGVDGAVDAALLHAELVPAVRDGGGFVSVRGWHEDVGRGVTVHPVMVGDYVHRADLLRELTGLVEDGRLTPRVARTFPAAQAAEAHRLLEAGGLRGRPVLTF
ncbi:NADP-dependent oxidoreductase [Georgenia alba]|uniref:NADP-dependent oxidoreductase n=1 Tax=Georgenia alba TaxID=2233858 RepID=A0ABW2Q7E0_9MICO